MAEPTNTDLAVALARLEGKVDSVAILVPTVRELDKHVSRHCEEIEALDKKVEKNTSRLDGLESSRNKFLGAILILPAIGTMLAWVYDKLPLIK
jgi:predicted  nucleic acid-binding Zn-ribbon protein